jgi:hypothetical protein
MIGDRRQLWACGQGMPSQFTESVREPELHRAKALRVITGARRHFAGRQSPLASLAVGSRASSGTDLADRRLQPGFRQHEAQRQVPKRAS